jgi:mono/diheme cytochrome c family protein
MRASSNNSRGFGLLNTFLLTGSAALLVWGGLYVGNYSGRFDGNEFNELPYGRPVKVVGGGESADPLAAAKKAGLIAYGKTCVACHQADGNGNAALNIPPLAGSDWVLADGPNRIIRIVMHGMQGPVKVGTQVYQGNAMNPWLKTADNPAGLSEQEIADVLTYIRNSWGNKASAVTVEQVKAVAAEVQGRTDAWTAEELEKIPASGGGAAPTPTALTPEQLKEALKKLSADELKALLDGVQAK